MAASIDPNVTHSHHPAGCGCEGCLEAAADGPTSGAGTSTEVSDYTALLYYNQSNSLRWNGQTDIGTQVVVTYSFTETNELGDAEADDPYDATAYWSYNEAQRALFREVTEQYEDISGVIFVEIEGDAMINVYGSTGGTAGGWANVAQSTESSTSNGDLTNNYMNMDEGDYGYQVNLHELGHAMGLQHPHEGMFVLADNVDTQANTVMTYNIQQPYVSELGGFDIEAMQDIYGAADSFDGWTVTVDNNDVVTISATNGSETILATDQNTIVNAGKGKDEVIGREGDDTLNGDKGRDTITGGLGDDSIYGGGGLDVLYGDLDANPYSGDSDDYLHGGGGDDTLYGGDGDDELNGGGKNDYLDGGYGEDFLRGSNGDDTLTGGDGADKLSGGKGADVFLFLNADAYETNRIVDFTVGEDLMDVSSFGFSALSQFTQTVTGGDTFLSYSNWFEIELSNFTETLSTSDFIFA